MHYIHIFTCTHTIWKHKHTLFLHMYTYLQPECLSNARHSILLHFIPLFLSVVYFISDATTSVHNINVIFSSLFIESNSNGFIIYSRIRIHTERIQNIVALPSLDYRLNEHQTEKKHAGVYAMPIYSLKSKTKITNICTNSQNVKFHYWWKAFHFPL